MLLSGKFVVFPFIYAQDCSNIIIEEWDINSNQSIYREDLANIYVEHMSKDFVVVLPTSFPGRLNFFTSFPISKRQEALGARLVVLNEQCVGCQLQEGNQLAHELCLSGNVNQQIRKCFAILLEE